MIELFFRLKFPGTSSIRRRNDFLIPQDKSVPPEDGKKEREKERSEVKRERGEWSEDRQRLDGDAKLTSLMG